MMGAMGERCVLCFVGQMGVGKQYMAERLVRYLQFFQGAHCRLFDAATFEDDASVESVISTYLSERDESAEAQLRDALDDVGDLPWYVDAGKIAVVFTSAFVAGSKWSGSTREKRRSIASLELTPKLLFIEIQATDPRDSKLPTYAFESIDEQELRYVRIRDFGETVTTHLVRNVLMLLVVKYLTHIHASRRSIYITRHGQSEYNKLKKIGGNPGLTEEGEKYSKWLAGFAQETICHCEKSEIPARLWTSTMRRTIETARYISHHNIQAGDTSWTQMQHRVSRNLDELFAGDYDGMTYEEIADQFEGECFLRKIDKLGYRYPRGESYLDLIARLDPFVHELESYREPILIISHQATLRVLYAYLTDTLRSDSPKISIPLHTVIKLTWEPWCSHPVESRFTFDPDLANIDDGQLHF